MIWCHVFEACTIPREQTLPVSKPCNKKAGPTTLTNSPYCYKLPKTNFLLIEKDKSILSFFLLESLTWHYDQTTNTGFKFYFVTLPPSKFIVNNQNWELREKNLNFFFNF